MWESKDENGSQEKKDRRKVEERIEISDNNIQELEIRINLGIGEHQ